MYRRTHQGTATADKNRFHYIVKLYRTDVSVSQLSSQYSLEHIIMIEENNRSSFNKHYFEKLYEVYKEDAPRSPDQPPFIGFFNAPLLDQIPLCNRYPDPGRISDPGLHRTSTIQ